MSSDRLLAKTERYERLLATACAEAELVDDPDSPGGRLAAEHLEMAESYLADGRHFHATADPVNALAAFAYGHGWLDAAVRSGLVDAPAQPAISPEE